jgi:predicted phosphodiesterase
MGARTSYKAWTEGEVAELRRLAEDQRPSHYIADKLGRSRASVSMKAQQLRIPIGPRERDDDVAEWEARRDAHERSVQRTNEHLAEVFDWLRPVHLPAPDVPKARVRPNLKRRLVISDAHFPLHCEKTLDLFVQAVALLRPWQVILAGDMCDLFSVSKYPPDARARFRHTLRDEVVAYHEFLHRLVTVGSAWGMKLVQVNANHDGDGIEGRWWRYISSNAPALAQHPRAEELLSFKTWFVPDWCDIEMADEVLVGDVLVTHGTIVRGKGGYSARAHMERYHHSVLHGHTHRQGMSVQRIPAVGDRPEAVQKSFEIGCACDLNPTYAQRPDWTNGFAILTEDEGGKWAQVELVTVQDGRATVSALDATLVAA